MKYTCTGRAMDKNNKVIGYLLISDMGMHLTMKSDELKERMRAGTMTVTNLKLTSNNRLILTNASASSIGTAEFKKKAEEYRKQLANIIKTTGKAPDNLSGYPITKLYNTSKKEFYILSLSDSVHILIIPDNLEHVILGNCDNPLRRIRGSVYVVGGENLVSSSTLFGQCQLDTVDITAMKTQKLEEAEYMFAGSNVKEIVANKLKTPVLRSIKGMFYGSTISKLTLTFVRQPYNESRKELDRLNMENMFSCSRADSIKFSVNITNDAVATDMFSFASIVELNIKGIDFKKITQQERLFNGATIGNLIK